MLSHKALTTAPRLHVPIRIGTRSICVLAIESSCDDTSAAVADFTSTRTKVHFHEKVTANNDGYTGIHPLVALHSHRANLGLLVQRALAAGPKPTLVAATRGPGMRSNLATGLELGKGLSLGLNVPFLGIHHMQAHALTSRLVSSMKNASLVQPRFPFLSLLVSGGHTMLIDSAALCQHTILAETQDIALGDCLDKAARAILPPDLVKTPYGKALEDFAFLNGDESYHYVPPARRREELELRKTRWKWAIAPPFRESKSSSEKTTRRMAYSFSGLLSSVERFLARKIDGEGQLTNEPRFPTDISLDERRDMAREVLRVTFEHLASRLLLYLENDMAKEVQTVVVSGGVASNQYLRHVLRTMLDVRGFSHVELDFPPVSLCTDNALMIAWTALEMWNAGYESDLSCQPLRKWSMDSRAEDGGILGVDAWLKRTESAIS